MLYTGSTRYTLPRVEWMRTIWTTGRSAGTRFDSSPPKPSDISSRSASDSRSFARFAPRPGIRPTEFNSRWIVFFEQLAAEAASTKSISGNSSSVAMITRDEGGKSTAPNHGKLRNSLMRAHLGDYEDLDREPKEASRARGSPLTPNTDGRSAIVAPRRTPSPKSAIPAGSAFVCTRCDPGA